MNRRNLFSVFTTCISSIFNLFAMPTKRYKKQIFYIKAHFHYSLLFLLVILFFTNCGKIKKEIGKNNIAGEYFGTSTFVYKFSQLNVGVEDKEMTGNCSVIFHSKTNIPSLEIKTYPDKAKTNIEITGINLLDGATAFNIPDQMMRDGNSELNIQGIPSVTDTDGNKKMMVLLMKKTAYFFHTKEWFQ